MEQAEAIRLFFAVTSLFNAVSECPLYSQFLLSIHRKYVHALRRAGYNIYAISNKNRTAKLRSDLWCQVQMFLIKGDEVKAGDAVSVNMSTIGEYARKATVKWRGALPKDMRTVVCLFAELCAVLRDAARNDPRCRNHRQLTHQFSARYEDKKEALQRMGWTVKLELAMETKDESPWHIPTEARITNLERIDGPGETIISDTIRIEIAQPTDNTDTSGNAPRQKRDDTLRDPVLSKEEHVKFMRELGLDPNA